MLKKRLIPCTVVKDGTVVQSYGFKRYQPIGRPEIAVEYFVSWDVDEIIVLDISATPHNSEPNYEMIKRLSQHCFLPITIGGGIKSTGHIRQALISGADKICINTHAIESPKFITESAEMFGDQCIVVGIDVWRHPDGRLEVFSHGGRKPTGKDPIHWAKELESLGAGELFINSINRDGARTGYDLPLVQDIATAVSIPVIACGGAGKMSHFTEALEIERLSAVSAANIFQFTEHSTVTAKAFMERNGIPIRLESEFHYKECEITDTGRLIKRDEAYLDRIRNKSGKVQAL